MSFSVIGDVHGKYRRVHEIIREKDRYPFLVQLGDFGFDYATLDNVDPEKFKIVGGNHDNYDKIIDIPHYLGDFGYTSLNGTSFFFYRGAWSIDRIYRTIGIDWWEQEELSLGQFAQAKDLYEQVKPSIMITHDCPMSIADELLEPWQQRFNNNTGHALEQLYEIHQPDLWLFGHWHMSKTIQKPKTTFRLLNELEVYTINKE